MDSYFNFNYAVLKKVFSPLSLPTKLDSKFALCNISVLRGIHSFSIYMRKKKCCTTARSDSVISLVV